MKIKLLLKNKNCLSLLIKPSKTIRLLLMVLFVFLFGNTLTAQTFPDNTPGTRTWTVPCGVTSITVEAWGGGGAGGGTASKNLKGGGGGAGGTYATSMLTVTPGDVITYTVGAGATGGMDKVVNGKTSSIVVAGITVVSAQGGAGGATPNNADVAGGIGSSITSIGTTLSPGISGGNGTTAIGGAGGNGANNGGAGGASRSSSEGNGNNGASPGGGGGGGFITDGTDHRGGHGGDGQITITYVSSFKTYCTPSYNQGVEPITNVTFAGINNSTTNVLGGSSLESLCITGSVVQGSALNAISIKGNTDGNFTEFIKVYIDWDQNGVFGNVANEIYDLGSITNSTGIDAISATGNINVPGTAVLGTTKMRVMKAYYSATTNDPCFSGNDWGQAEDYIINVIAPPTITSFTPSSGCANVTSVVITGTNFTGATAVTFGGTNAASFTVNSATQITAIPASGTTGLIKVTTSQGTATSATNLMVNALPSTPTATITDATCSNGSNGAIVITNLDSAIEFKMADNDYIDLGSSTMLSGKSAFTVEGWIKFNKADIGNRMSLFGQNDVVEFGFMSSTTFDCWTIGGGSVSTALPVSLGDNTWHHVAAVGNGTNLKIYIDGVSVATGGSATTNYGSSTFNTKIGGGVIDATGGSFTGQIKKVGFYSTALSAATITGLAASPTIYTGAEAGLIAAYNFSEGVGTTLAKLPAGTNGTFQNTPEWNYSYSWTKTGVPAFSASTKNISGLSPGQYNLAVSTVGGICPKTTSFTVGSTNTAPTITAMTATVCNATTFTVTPVNGTNGMVPAGTTYTWSAPALSPLASITGGSAQATGQATISQTLTNTTTAVATATYTVTPLSGSCAGSTFTVTVTITPTAAPPTATKTDATCALATGSITITSPVPAAGITFTVTGTSPVVAAVTNATGVFPGLAVGSYNFTVTNSSGCISGASSVTILPLVTNTWTMPGAIGTWSLGTPTVDQNLDFQGNYNLGVDVEGCSCKVNSGAAVVFKTGSTLKITNEVKVLSGTLTFENNASLVQINDAAVNKGDIIYMRKTNSVRSSDYTYWSSPVAGQLLKDVSPSYTSGMFYSFNSTNWVSEAISNVMEVGKGYIIRGPQSNLPPAFYDASFKGIPNNGLIPPITIGAAGTSNLIGNPYPCALDADAFLNDSNNKNVLAGTIYFWTHNTPIRLATGAANEGSGAYVYISDDYASYNGVGGVATLPAPSIATGGLININIPSGKIAAGQSFFATSKAAGTAIFNNSMRVGVGGITGDNAQFFKINTTKAKSAGAVGKNRIWLNLTNSQGAFKQALVGYVAEATNGYDGRFDGESFDGNTFIDFYSVNQDKNLAIQGRALPFDEADTVPLGYKTTIVGNFTIAIDQTDGFFTTQNVFIEDKLLNTTHDLKEGPYTFSTVKGVFNDRFVLRYTNKTLGALGTQDFTTQQNQVLVSNKNKQIKINTDVETIDKVQVYDLLGKQIYQKTNVDSKELAIADLLSSHQVLVVKTVLQNGQTITKKIIF